MGGGGSYYDRDVTSKSLRSTSTGVSTVAERALGRTSIDSALLPKNRRLICTARNPLVYGFDETGSMDTLPKIIWDKWPGIVGQVVAREYLPDPEMSISAIGDIRSDDSAVQICDFSPLRNLDKWLKRIHFEKNGGGQGSESYEMNAYYYANFCDMPNAELPIYLVTGDEACVPQLYERDLEEHFGGKHKDTTAKKVFADLLGKFKGNVFRIQRYYAGRGREDWSQSKIVSQWESFIGKERIIHLPQGKEGDLAIGDITLGVYAIVSGARTLKQYLGDMSNRDLELGKGVKYEPQSKERIKQVEEALQPLKDFKPVKSARSTTVAGGPKKLEKKTDGGPKKDKSWKV
jgi:hypothetical protein